MLPPLPIPGYQGNITEYRGWEEVLKIGFPLLGPVGTSTVLDPLLAFGLSS